MVKPLSDLPPTDLIKCYIPEFKQIKGTNVLGKTVLGRGISWLKNNFIGFGHRLFQKYNSGTFLTNERVKNTLTATYKNISDELQTNDPKVDPCNLKRIASQIKALRIVESRLTKYGEKISTITQTSELSAKRFSDLFDHNAKYLFYQHNSENSNGLTLNDMLRELREGKKLEDSSWEWLFPNFEQSFPKETIQVTLTDSNGIEQSQAVIRYPSALKSKIMETFAVVLENLFGFSCSGDPITIESIDKEKFKNWLKNHDPDFREEKFLLLCRTLHTVGLSDLEHAFRACYDKSQRN